MLPSKAQHGRKRTESSIGVDPSEYRYDAERDAQIYSWYAAESKARVMHVWFKDDRLYACGVYNLGFPKMT